MATQMQNILIGVEHIPFIFPEVLLMPVRTMDTGQLQSGSFVVTFKLSYKVSFYVDSGV